MKRNNGGSIRASALQIALALALISISAILLAMAASNNTETASRQMTAAGQSSGITAPVMSIGAPNKPQPGLLKMMSPDLQDLDLIALAGFGNTGNLSSAR